MFKGTESVTTDVFNNAFVDTKNEVLKDEVNDTNIQTQEIEAFDNNKLIDNDGLIHPLRTVLISPTLDANPIFKNLKSRISIIAE